MITGWEGGGGWLYDEFTYITDQLTWYKIHGFYNFAGENCLAKTHYALMCLPEQVVQKVETEEE